MLWPALISAVMTLQSELPPPMSLPLEDIFCFDREAPPPRPIRTRACVEVDGAPGMECWPDLPASAPNAWPLWSVRSFLAGSIVMAAPPSFIELGPLDHTGRPSDGHARLLDEPPRA